MRKYFFFVPVFFAFQFAYSQVILSGIIQDSETALPVDYVNIGLVEKAQGTVSDMDGTFELRLRDASPTDTVRISRIGYKPLQFLLGQLQSRLKESAVIPLEQELTSLDEVVITNKDAMKNRIGYNYITEDLVAYWNNSRALGGEHASKIMVRKGPLKLEDLSFHVIRNISDSLLVRVNVYEIDKGLPGRNITRENILYTIKEKSGKVIIDLSPYDIVVDDHFIVSLEMLKVYGDKVGMTIAAYHDGYRSYSRLISQDRWRRMRKGTTIAFNLNTSAVEKYDPSVAMRKKRLSKPELVTILWDNSISMEKRNSNKELEYLETFFRKVGNTKVQFQTFGHEIGESLQFSIRNGKWDNLRDYISQNPNDGAVSQKTLEALKPGEFTLLFTDGLDFSEDVHRDWTGSVYPVNSSSKSNSDVLAGIAFDTGGDFINLADRYDLDRAADYKRMQGNYVSNSWEIDEEQPEFITVKGNVSDYEDSLESVLVSVKNSDRKTRTDAGGNFSIQALAGETLVFTYPGRIGIEALVNSGTRFLTIAMPIGVKVLDEVVLKESTKVDPVSIGVYGEKKKIRTNYGILDPAKSGFGVRQIRGEDLFVGAATIAEALAGKFSGVTLNLDYSMAVQNTGGNRTPTDPQGVARPRNMFRANVPKLQLRGADVAWDIDGQFYTADNVPDHVMIQNIETVTIMPGAWAVARYGKEASGGIAIVRTINNNFDDIQPRKDPLEDQALLTNNYYQGEAVFPENDLEKKPLYIQEIYSRASVEDSYQQYLAERNKLLSNSDFYAEMHDLFLDRWKTLNKASRILSNIREIQGANINALRLLAYKYEEIGQFDRALEIYEQIYALAPDELQSVRDLAQSHVLNQDYNTAWKHYNKYLTIKNDSLGDEGLDKVVRQEMLELAEKHHENIDIDKSAFTFDQEREDISIVVQWNNPNAEFELQFVGPSNQYYIWKHTELDNMSLLSGERIDGSYSKSFGIQDIGEGPWKINTKYIGNKENTPSYLKFTIDDNLKSSETIKVMKLQKSNVNYRSFDISKDDVISIFK